MWLVRLTTPPSEITYLVYRFSVFKMLLCSPNNRELREALSPPHLKNSSSTVRAAEQHFEGDISKSSSTYRELGEAFCRPYRKLPLIYQPGKTGILPMNEKSLYDCINPNTSFVQFFERCWSSPILQGMGTLFSPPCSQEKWSFYAQKNHFCIFAQSNHLYLMQYSV